MEKTTSTVARVSQRLRAQHADICGRLRALGRAGPLDRDALVDEVLRWCAAHEAVEGAYLHSVMGNAAAREGEQEALGLALGSLQRLGGESPSFDELLATITTAMRRHFDSEERELLRADLSPQQCGEAHRALDIVDEMATQSGGPFTAADDFATMRRTARQQVALLAAQVR